MPRSLIGSSSRNTGIAWFQSLSSGSFTISRPTHSVFTVPPSWNVSFPIQYLFSHILTHVLVLIRSSGMECRNPLILHPRFSCWCVRDRLPRTKVHSRTRCLSSSHLRLHHVRSIRAIDPTHRCIRRYVYVPTQILLTSDGLFLTFGEFGPGDNIGLMAAKSSATCIRGQFYGIAAAIGKIGAFSGAYAFEDVPSHQAISNLDHQRIRRTKHCKRK